MRYSLVFGFLLACVVQAQAQQKPTPLKLSAVAGQEIEMQTGMSLNRACENMGIARLGIVKPTKNGTITERPKEFHSTFSRENMRYVCNDKKSPGMAVYYKPNDGFKGVDKFVFSIVYYDGTASIYNAEIVVW